MSKCSRVFAAIGVVWAASACDQSPAFVQPPASEYAVGRFDLATPPADTIQGATVSQEFVRIIGIHVLLGRLFIAEDFRPAATPTAVISYHLWNRRFGSDPAIIGRTVRLNGADVVVVGVTPQNFEFPRDVEVWLPRRSAASP